RTGAYPFYEHNPGRGMVPVLLAALEKEQAEFVRPALVRALAAAGGDPEVQRTLVHEAGRGEDFFRSAVIEVLGDYKASYALQTFTATSKLHRPPPAHAPIPP